MVETTICTIPGCGNPMRARSWCTKHYGRWKRHGDPLIMLTADKGAGQEFLESVVLPFEGDDCLLWPYGRHRFGYGAINIDGRPYCVHVIACKKANGPKPSPAHEAAHSCGNGHKGCVNPRHMRWATRQENAADRVIHGTAFKGANHPSAKLTDEDVRQIRALAGTMPWRMIAERFPVKISMIGHIINGTRWTT